MKFIKMFLFITVFSVVLTFATNFTSNKIETGKIWVGVSYGLSEQGQSNEVVAAVGVGGALQSALYGAAAGAVFGGPVGFGVGLAVSL